MAKTKLTTGYDSFDDFTGSEGKDVFTAKVLGNSNTFQSGDEIDGGAGIDTLNIVLGNESAFAISAETKNLEIVSVRSQAVNAKGNSGANNISYDDDTADRAEGDDAEYENVIDAQGMVGVKEFWNTDSRADLVIEDVRIGGIANPAKNAKGQVTTENVTIGWKNTDPSSMDDKVDYEVYFSPESLRASSEEVVRLEIYNTGKQSTGMYDVDEPLKDFYFDTLVLNVNNKDVTLDLSAFLKAEVKDYKAFESVLLDALAKSDAPVSLVKIDQGKKFTSEDGDKRFADVFELVPTAGSTISKAKSKFETTTADAKDTDTSISTYLVKSATPPLITSKVVLDNVGRESEAGDLVIGSMSTRSGVDKFKVEVLRDKDTRNDADDVHGNWVGSMSSTNEKLQEVVITKNDGAYLYVGTGMEEGANNLVDSRSQPDFVKTDGLNDVRVFDAGVMKGNVKVGATLDNTDGSDGKIVGKNKSESAKYKLDNMSSDTRAYYDSDDDGLVDFNYTTGSGDDTINLAVSDQCDLNVDMSSGADKLQVTVAAKDDHGNVFAGDITIDFGDALTKETGKLVTDGKVDTAELILAAGLTKAKVTDSEDATLLKAYNEYKETDVTKVDFDYAIYSGTTLVGTVTLVNYEAIDSFN